MTTRFLQTARRALCLPLLLVGAAASAQSISELQALSRAGEQPASGIALAHKQAADGYLLDALSTLERVILNSPNGDEARLYHASLLCQLDDRQGAMVEFEALHGHNISAAAWSEATAPCNVKKGRQ
ncbi:MAG: hypothetical protein ABIW31_02120 [Novosphingobium sp.]